LALVGAPLEFPDPQAVATAGNYVWVLDQSMSKTVKDTVTYTVTQLTRGGREVREIALSTEDVSTAHFVGVLAYPRSITATPSDLG
jgi:hypothetical protein